MSRYRITESVGNRVESVSGYRDLEKHHPSSGREPGRDYETINGELEEVRRTSDGRTLIKKDFILSHDGPGPVNIPAPVAGYIHHLNDTTNAVRIYDRPFGQDGASLMAQSLHMVRGTSPPEGSRIEYGQPMGRMGDTGSPGSIHAHVEVETAQFQRYIRDVSSGAITPERFPTPGVPGRFTSSPGGVAPLADGVLQVGERGTEVTRVQQQLNALGFKDSQGRTLVTDGDFGQSTRQAVEVLQRARGLEVDGVVGKETFAVLNRAQQSDPSPANGGGQTVPVPAPAPVQATPRPAGQYGPTPLSNLIGSGEGDYNSFNRGRAGDSVDAAPLNLAAMTVGEIMRRQDLPRNDPDRLFAVGKFQIIPGTMEETVRRLGIDSNQRYTPALQEGMFADYLIDEKRPAVNAYITGSSSGAQGLGRAQLALAQEFASVADPRTGRSFYDGDSAGNSASITAAQAAAALDRMRAQYRQNIDNGLSPADAYRGLGRIAPAAPLPVQEGARRSGSESLIQRGDSGAQVLALQQQLERLGHRDAQGRTLWADERFGDRTYEAVQSFQRSARLEPDGVVGRDTSAALRAAQTQAPDAPRAMMEGASGADVRQLQEQLNRLGYGGLNTMPVDSDFGPRTTQAVQQFQRLQGLAVDGVVGTATMEALGKAQQLPLLSDAAHPDHGMYRQAMEGLGRLEPQRLGINSDREMANAGASLAFEARASGLSRIDHVVLSANGQSLFAVQGRLDDPAQDRVHVGRAQAIALPVARSTIQLEHHVRERSVAQLPRDQDQEQRHSISA